MDFIALSLLQLSRLPSFFIYKKNIIIIFSFFKCKIGDKDTLLLLLCKSLDSLRGGCDSLFVSDNQLAWEKWPCK